MNFKKYLLIPTIAVALSTTVVIDLNASEIDTTSKTITAQATDVVYAPINPTTEEVAAAASTDLVVFNDPWLGYEVSVELGVPVDEITVGDMESLTYLEHNGWISDLTGLEYAINLEHLELWGNSVSDLTPLSGLTNLTYLSLGENEISDVTPLSGLTNLTTLELRDNNISDVTPLSGLTNLEYLILDDNHISDISPLSGLINLTNFQARTQTIELEATTVYSDDYVYYNVTDINGVESPILLGKPTNGTSNMHGSWMIVNSIGAVVDGSFSGSITQDVTYIESSTLTGSNTASASEETTLSDNELIALFEVINSDGEVVTVDQSAVDYTTPGEYQVLFTDETGNEFVGMLTILDVLPALSVDNNTVTIMINSKLDDILNQLNYSATEISDGDLTDIITIDDSSVDYSTPGTYEMTLTVVDEEGNIASRTITVTIEDETTEIVDPEQPEVVDPEQPEVVDPEQPEVVNPDSRDEVTSEDENDNDSQMSLVTTGGKAMGTIIVLVTIIIGALGIKKVIKE